MKKSSLFLLSIFSIVGLNYAQESTQNSVENPKSLQVGYVNFFLGGNNDVYKSMDFHQMRDFASTKDELRDVNLDDYEGTFYSRVDGVILRTDIGFNVLDRSTGTYKDNREIRFGAGIHTGREGMIEYNKELQGSNGVMDQESVIYCIIENEVELSASYLYRGKVGDRFSYYAGFGGNLSTTFNNQFLMIFSRYTTGNSGIQEETSSDIYTYEAKSAVYSRMYIPFGASYRFSKRLEAGLDWRLGVGMQHVVNGRTNFIKKTGATVVGLRYNVNI